MTDRKTCEQQQEVVVWGHYVLEGLVTQRQLTIQPRRSRVVRLGHGLGGTFNTCWKEVSTEPTAQEQGGVRPGAVGLFCYDEKSPPDGTAHAGSTRRRNEGKEKCLSETLARCPNPMTQCQKLPFRDQKKSLCQTHWPGFLLPTVKAPPSPPPAARWLTGPRQVPSVRERLTFALHARGRCLVVPFRIW